jgi:hypothetical protein
MKLPDSFYKLCMIRARGATSKDVTPPLEIHKRIRRLVREEAAKLG